MRNIAESYGLKINHMGFAKCCFHEEKTASLKIYEKGFFCFGCGVGGDLIKFVALYENISNREACVKLNGGETKVTKIRKRKMSLKEWENEAYKTLNKYLTLLKAARNVYDLKLFEEACQNIDYVTYCIDWLIADPESFYLLNKNYVMEVNKKLCQIFR
jgi:DNA primase